MISRICPPPPDCPLYERRLTYAADEPLRRAVLIDRSRCTDLAALVHAEAVNCPKPVIPTAPPTRPELPSPLPQTFSISDLQKGAIHD